MATAAGFLQSSTNGFIKNSKQFEMNVKEKLKWNKKQWQQSGESGTRLNKLCNSLNYWKVKLKEACEDVSIVFTIFNEASDVKTALVDIIMAIEAIDSKISVQGFAEFRNPRYLCLYFSSKEERDFVMENFKMMQQNYVVYLSWALDSGADTLALNVYWLPMTFKVDIIKKELERYVQCIEEERMQLTFMSGRNMPSGKVAFKVLLNEGVTAAEIPHVLQISKMEALVTVSGRQPLCLNCNEIGHISKNCKLRYCSVCVSLKQKGHNCINSDKKKSYAMVVKNDDKADDKIDPDDWSSAITISNEQQVNDQSLALSEKIVSIQEKISVLKENLVDTNGTFLKKNLLSVDSCSEIFEQGNKEMQEENIEMQDQVQSYESSDSSFDVDEATIDSMENITSEDKMSFSTARKKKRNQTKVKKRENIKTEKVEKAKIKAGNNEITEPEHRSYGKPNYGNTRRLREESKFRKLDETREFIFKD